MAGNTLDGLFGVETIMGLVKGYDTTAFDKYFSDLFRASAKAPDAGGDSVSWDEVTFDRDLAPVTGDESPAPRVKNYGYKKSQAFLADVKLYTDINGRRLFRQRGPGKLVSAAEDVLGYELKNLQLRVQKTINYFAVKLLLGSLTISAANIPGSDVTFPAIAPAVNTWTKGTSWATNSTKILSVELDDLINNASTGYISNAGKLPGFAIVNNSVEKYLVQNTEVQAWATHQFGSIGTLWKPAQRDVFSGAEIGGLRWAKDVHGYVPAGGSFTKFMPDDKVIIMPPMEELSDVLAMAEGFGLIPRQAYGAETANGLIEEAPRAGFYGYAVATESPVGVRLYCGWRGLPIVKFPKAITVGTVV